MASFPLRADSALSNLVPIAAILARFDRATLESFMTVAVDLLDVADGDIDHQDSGDAEDETLTEIARASSH